MNLRTARTEKSKTQWDLRLETGIHQSKISLIERGYIRPSKEEKRKIAQALKISINDIEWPNEAIH